MNLTSTSHISVFSRLRWRLTFLFLLIAILPIMILTVIAVQQVERQVRTQIVNQMESVAILKQQQIEQWLLGGREQLNFMLVAPQLVLALQVPGFSIQAAEVMQDITDTSSTIEDIFFYNEEGEIVLSSNPVLNGRIVNRQPYFEASLLGEHLEPPYFDVSSGRLALIATVPMYSNGELLAIVAIRYNTEELSSIMLERAGLGETGETYLVSQENNYFLTPSRFDNYPQNRAYTSVGIDRALNGETGVGEYGDYRNPPVPVFGNYRWIPELQSGLLTEIDQAEGLAALNALRGATFFLAVVISGVVALIGFLVTARLVNPIIQITNSAAAIAKGNFEQRVALTRSDEIGVMATAFNDMAQAIQDRTTQLQLARDEALVAQRIARENSRLKSEFLATMSHELRTPMNAIEGFCSIMLKRMAGVEYNDKTERYLSKIQANSQRLLSLINDFLDLSRIESGRMELASMPVSPEEMVQKWHANLSVLAESKGLTFEISVDPNLPTTMQGDEEALSKIAINLVGNAIKFTETGSVLMKLEKRDHNMALEVRDTGIGIPPHAREFIFDEFRQVDQSSKRKHGGTGLGVPIVQKLAREMGGTVTLQSEVGVGSTFTVLLPIETEAESEALTIQG